MLYARTWGLAPYITKTAKETRSPDAYTHCTVGQIMCFLFPGSRSVFVNYLLLITNSMEGIFGPLVQRILRLSFTI
jgi:hypothetical protein